MSTVTHDGYMEGVITAAPPQETVGKSGSEMKLAIAELEKQLKSLAENVDAAFVKFSPVLRADQKPEKKGDANSTSSVPLVIKIKELNKKLKSNNESLIKLIDLCEL